MNIADTYFLLGEYYQKEDIDNLIYKSKDSYFNDNSRAKSMVQYMKNGYGNFRISSDDAMNVIYTCDYIESFKKSAKFYGESQSDRTVVVFDGEFVRFYKAREFDIRLHFHMLSEVRKYQDELKKYEGAFEGAMSKVEKFKKEKAVFVVLSAILAFVMLLMTLCSCALSAQTPIRRDFLSGTAKLGEVLDNELVDLAFERSKRDLKMWKDITVITIPGTEELAMIEYSMDLDREESLGYFSYLEAYIVETYGEGTLKDDCGGETRWLNSDGSTGLLK